MISKLNIKIQNLVAIATGYKSKNLKTCDVILICHDNDRGAILKNRAYSPLLDSLREELESLGLKCISIALPFAKLINQKAHGEPVSINRPYLLAQLKSKLYKKLNLFPPNLGSSHVQDLYQKIFKATNAKLIITIGSSPQIARAARSLEIFHAELIHGIGYPKIPWGWDSLPAEELPQCIISLDRVSTKTFSALTNKAVIVKQLPHPYIRRFISARSRQIPEEWEGLELKNKSIKKQILVSLTWGYWGDHGPYTFLYGILKNGLFPEELTEAIEHTRTKNIYWRFRLHPIHLRDQKYKKLLDFLDNFIQAHANCEWKLSSTLPLPAVAMMCDGNISMSSMTCYDVAYLGVPSLMLCPTIQRGAVNETYFEDLVVSGHVKKALSTATEIIDWTTEVRKISPILNGLENNEIYYDALFDVLNLSNINIDRFNSKTVLTKQHPLVTPDHKT